jgi:hypothetical protein
MDVDLNLCRKVGVGSAMVYSLIKDRCENEGVFFEGHPYTCLSMADIHSIFDFYSLKTIQRILHTLEDNNLIESKVFVGTKRWRRIKNGLQN